MEDVDISCIVCLELAISAYDTKCCHVILCEECIAKLSVCPNCRKKLIGKQYLNVPISRLAKQFDEKSKRIISDKEIICTQATKYIDQIWNDIDQNPQLMNIISLYSIIKVIGFEQDQINIIGKLLVKQMCKEITKTSIFNTTYKYSCDDMSKGYPIAKQNMVDMSICFKNYKQIVEIHFDGCIDLLNVVSHQNVFNELSHLMSDTICNNFMRIIACLLFSVDSNHNIFGEVLSILTSINKTNEKHIKEIEININHWIKFKTLSSTNARICYQKLNNSFITLNNIVQQMDNMSWLNNILSKYINDIHKSKSILDQCNDDTLNIFVGMRHIWKSKHCANSKGNIPAQFANQCDNIINYSNTIKEPRHKLSWDFAYGCAEIEIYFNSKCSRTIICSTYQMMILLLFNDHELLTFKEILELTGTSENILENHLLSLCHPTVCIIRKRPNCATLLDTDKFMLNWKYTDEQNPRNIPLLRRVRGNIPLLQPVQIPKPEPALLHIIDSKLVCLSMCERTMDYNLMIKRVLSSVKDADESIVIQCINNLIAQEYMEIRTENDIKYVIYIP